MTAPDTHPRVIVLGNEKGGTGKSTITIHVIVSLLHAGYTVGSIDTDARQGTLTRYLQNRQRYSDREDLDLLCPTHIALHQSHSKNLTEAAEDETHNFKKALSSLEPCDYIVIDTPGNDTNLSKLAHSHADILITPLNDSFIDLDMLVKIEDLEDNTLTPSLYAETVWEQKKNRLVRDRVTMDWIVLRNRLSHINARNKQEMWRVMSELSKRFGYRLSAGFSERVIFRELFLSGTTLLDLERMGRPFTLSHVAARQELRSLMGELKLPGFKEAALEAA